MLIQSSHAILHKSWKFEHVHVYKQGQQKSTRKDNPIASDLKREEAAMGRRRTFREVEEHARVAFAVACGAHGRLLERLRGVTVELRADDGGGEAKADQRHQRLAQAPNRRRPSSRCLPNGHSIEQLTPMRRRPRPVLHRGRARTTPPPPVAAQMCWHRHVAALAT